MPNWEALFEAHYKNCDIVEAADRLIAQHCGVRGDSCALSCQGITIKSADILDRAKKNNYPVTQEDGQAVLQSPDGYKFFIVSEQVSGGKEHLLRLAAGYEFLVVSETGRKHLEVRLFCSQ